jgi:hypothetical protein
VFREYPTGVNAFNKAEGFVTLPSGIIIVRGVTTIQLNTWYHIVMTHDGLKLRLYVNGIQDGVLAALRKQKSRRPPVVLKFDLKGARNLDLGAGGIYGAGLAGFPSPLQDTVPELNNASGDVIGLNVPSGAFTPGSHTCHGA